MIYFVAYKGITKSPIKIGYTEDYTRLKTRVASMQTGSPWEIEVLGTMEGGYALERDLHRLFADWRIRGEWFQHSTPLINLIEWAKTNRALGKLATCKQAEMYIARSLAAKKNFKPRRMSRRAQNRAALKQGIEDGSITVGQIEDLEP